MNCAYPDHTLNDIHEIDVRSNRQSRIRCDPIRSRFAPALGFTARFHGLFGSAADDLSSPQHRSLFRTTFVTSPSHTSSLYIYFHPSSSIWMLCSHARFFIRFALALMLLCPSRSFTRNSHFSLCTSHLSLFRVTCQVVFANTSVISSMSVCVCARAFFIHTFRSCSHVAFSRLGLWQGTLISFFALTLSLCFEQRAECFSPTHPVWVIRSVVFAHVGCVCTCRSFSMSLSRSFTISLCTS